MKLISRISLHIVGYFLMGLAVTLIYRSHQGAYPIDAMTYYVHLISNHPFITIGMASIILNTLWAVFNFILSKKPQMFLSLILVFTFGYMIDFWNVWILKDFYIEDAFVQFLTGLSALILLSAAIALVTFNKRFPVTPSEAFLIFLADKLKHTAKAKILMELILTLIAITLALISWNFTQLGWLTVASVLFIGYIILFFQKIFSKFILVY
jgi:uncharacterized membrane protein YczE